MDAATVYAHLLLEHGLVGHEPRQWDVVKIVCLTQSDMEGNYLSEADYNFLFGIARNIQHALESADEVIREAGKRLRTNSQKLSVRKILAPLDPHGRDTKSCPAVIFLQGHRIELLFVKFLSVACFLKPRAPNGFCLRYMMFANLFDGHDGAA